MGGVPMWMIEDHCKNDPQFWKGVDMLTGREPWKDEMPHTGEMLCTIENHEDGLHWDLWRISSQCSVRGFLLRTQAKDGESITISLHVSNEEEALDLARRICEGTTWISVGQNPTQTQVKPESRH
jgi:hypothetical protein